MYAKGGQWGLNPQPSGPQPDALPIELWPPHGMRDLGDICGSGPPTLPAVARGQGFEPRYAAPKAAVLPLNDPRMLPLRGRCRGPDLNWGHRNFQSRALPTELPRRIKSEWLIAKSLSHVVNRPTSAIVHQPSAIGYLLERVTGFEPVTFSLARRRSTTEPHPQAYLVFKLRLHYTESRHPVKNRAYRRAPVFRWTRPDSNRRSSPCKGDAFPLGHGPMSTAELKQILQGSSHLIRSQVYILL